MKKFLSTSNLKNDILGGITAGIVALPLALAFGEQSGLGASAGLYGAAFIAFFAALFGGTPTQISGPTAPMTALSMMVIAGILEVFEGRLEEALPIILSVFLMAGIFQILIGVLKLGSYIKFIPHTVVSGFITGIGVIILITQLLPALGYYPGNDTEVVRHFKPQAEELLLERILREEVEDEILVLEDLQETAKRSSLITEEDILREALTLASNDGRGVNGAISYFPTALRNIRWVELILALLTIAIIYGFKKITRIVPSTLVALVLVTAGAFYMDLQYMRISSIETGFPAFHLGILTDFNFGVFRPYIFSALMLALLGAVDSLLTSVVADNMTRTRHNSNRELIGQGIGNSIGAFFGGLPGAGATIRTVVNIQAGGKTKISGMVSGILLFIIMLILGPIASQIPAAVLAGILITVGFDVMDYKGLRNLPKMELADKVILITVLVLTVFWQLVGAVAIGLVMASMVFLARMSKTGRDKAFSQSLTQLDQLDASWQDEINLPSAIKDKVVFKHLSGPMFFGMTHDFRELISGMGDLHLIVFRMEAVPFIDQSGLYAFEETIRELYSREILVVISGATPAVVSSMLSNEVIPKTIPGQYVFEEFEDCRRWLKAVLASEEKLHEAISKIHLD